MRGSIPQIDRLRALRARPAPGVPLAALVEVQVGRLRQVERDLRGMGEVWERVAGGGGGAPALPEAVRTRVHCVRVHRGRLELRCGDAAARFVVDRWLRGGGERALVTAEGSRVSGVRLV